MPRNSIIRKFGRKVYKATGYKNPYKKGNFMTSRAIKQVPKLAQDVSRIMGMLNTEKKRVIQVNSATQSVGQVNINNSGHWLLDITPNPSQGVGYDNKTGNSIKVVGSHFDFQFFSQVNCSNGCKIKIQVDINKLLPKDITIYYYTLKEFIKLKPIKPYIGKK